MYDNFEGYVTPKGNAVFARYKFHNKVQDQPVDQFMTELRLLSKDCRFFRHGRVVRYRIVFGPNSRKVRERLINEGATLKLSKAIDIARTVETSKATLEMESTKQIGRVQNSNKLETRKCSDFGGKLHGKSTSFPAHGQKFQKANHFAKVCRSRNCKRINPRLITDPFLY